LHRALAATLAADGAAPALIAVHLVAARDFGPARQALIAAADQHCAVHAYRDAARALRTALEQWPSEQEDGTRLAVVDRLARCAEMSSEYAEAVTLLRELADEHEQRGDCAALGGVNRRLALVHELRGQWDSALTAREAAAVAFCAAGLPAEAAIDRLAAATHLRAAGSYSAALGTLGAARADAENAAHDTAGRLGARFLRTACAVALSELGDKPHARASGRGPRPPAGLTGRELEIMLLVARGNTSRQIGEALFISPRTVEMHVQGSLLKLQCRTRAEAVRRLAELGTLPRPEQARRSR
jgi:DNA-binding CsgD family transcriptional regulator